MNRDRLWCKREKRVCRKLALGENETQMLSMDDLFKGRHFDRKIITVPGLRNP